MAVDTNTPDRKAKLGIASFEGETSSFGAFIRQKREWLHTHGHDISITRIHEESVDLSFGKKLFTTIYYENV